MRECNPVATLKASAYGGLMALWTADLHQKIEHHNLIT